MPQLNLFTFLSQTSWTILLFIFYYINMKQIIIPSLLEMIKLKKNSISVRTHEKTTKSDIFNSPKEYINIL